MGEGAPSHGWTRRAAVAGGGLCVEGEPDRGGGRGGRGVWRRGLDRGRRVGAGVGRVEAGRANAPGCVIATVAEVDLRGHGDEVDVRALDSDCLMRPLWVYAVGRLSTEILGRVVAPDPRTRILDCGCHRSTG